MGSDDREWRALAQELYMFILRYCTPSAMVPEDVIRRTLGEYARLARESKEDA